MVRKQVKVPIRLLKLIPPKFDTNNILIHIEPVSLFHVRTFNPKL